MIETGRISAGSTDEEMQAGIELCRAGQWERGLPLLARLADERGELSGQGYSWLGYGLAHRERRIREGLELCRQGHKLEFYQPDVLLNLARTELLAKNRRGAVRALETGLKLDPDHRGLRQLRSEMGLRRAPVLPFLSRSNPLNMLLGRIRHAVKGS